MSVLRFATPGARLCLVASLAGGSSCAPERPVRPGTAYVPHPPPTAAPSASARPRPEAVLDADGDGVPDSDDFCPSEPEDFDGCDDEDGCAEVDNDGDGLLDGEDRCPRKSGPKENGGCPVPPKPGTVVFMESDDSCLILDPVQFGPNEAVPAAQEHAVLEATAACLANHPRLLVLELRGDRAPREPRALAEQRAQAVLAGLVARGVDPRRLQATTAERSGSRLGARPGGEAPREKRAVHFYVRRELTCPDEPVDTDP